MNALWKRSRSPMPWFFDPREMGTSTNCPDRFHVLFMSLPPETPESRDTLEARTASAVRANRKDREG
jgi:hypothetical protein